jgi:hypothetical protein
MFCTDVQSVQHKYNSRSHDFMCVDRMTAAIKFNVAAKSSSSRFFSRALGSALGFNCMYYLLFPSFLQLTKSNAMSMT